MHSDEILHLGLGGTCDSHWDPIRDTSLPNTESVVPAYLKKAARIKRPFRSEALFMKDSRDISGRDQLLVADRVSESNARRVLLTSGTYLMPDVARNISFHYMSQFFEKFDKRVVITGSLVPLKGYLMSDFGFNLGMSLAVIDEDLEHRVLVVMNGSCFNAHTIQKDLSEASFSSAQGSDLLPYDSFTLLSIGGTLDFVLDGLDGMVPAEESFVPYFLRKQVRINRPFKTVTPFIKDSRHITPEQKNVLIEVIKDSPDDHILITAGVYQIQELQYFLQQNLGDVLSKKRIILTGSRMPLSLSEMSDAPFNIGYALGKLGFVEPGIYVALNGDMIPQNVSVLDVVYTPEEKTQILSQHLKS